MFVLTFGVKSSYERIFILGSGVISEVGDPMRYSPFKSAITLIYVGYNVSSKKVIVIISIRAKYKRSTTKL